eukprot:285475_1
MLQFSCGNTMKRIIRKKNILSSHKNKRLMNITNSNVAPDWKIGMEHDGQHLYDGVLNDQKILKANQLSDIHTINPLNERFESILNRKAESVLSKEIWSASFQIGKSKTLMKDPFTMSIYPQIIFELQPQSIIEFGTFTGGSADWLNSIVNTLNNQYKEKQNDKQCFIYTFDKYTKYLNKKIQKESQFPNGFVCYKNGDLASLDKSMPIEWLDNLPHPWLIIEDAHIDSNNLFKHLEKCKTLTTG